ncbi:hypothetical protein ABPG75_006008 [Micractinium tetrahymenae]
MSGQAPTPQDLWPPDFELPPLGDLLAAPDLVLPTSGLQAAPPVAPPPVPVPAPPPAAAAADDKLERQRALNRAKQARFRQRQKAKKEELEQQYEATAADLERERQLNETMRLSATILKKMQEHKDQALAALQGPGAGQQAQQPQQAQQGQRALFQELPSSSGQRPSDSGSGAGTPSGASGSLNASGAGAVSRDADCSGDAAAIGERFRALTFHEHVSLCTSIFKATEPARAALRPVGRDFDSFALETELKRSLGEVMVAAQPQLLTAALATTEADLLKASLEEWEDFGKYAADIVRQVEAGRMSEAEADERMRPAVLYQAVRNAILLSHKPTLILTLVQHTKLPGESEQAAADRWRRVALGMAITEEGAQGCLPHYQAYCHRMTRLGQEAASSMASLQELQQSLHVQLAELGDASLSSMVQQYLGLFEAASRLSQQPAAALLALMDLSSGAGRAVSPMQKTKMIAACRPLYPDTLAIVRCALEQHGLLPDELAAPPVLGALPGLSAGSGAATSGG